MEESSRSHTVRDLMRPAVTTVERHAHLGAAAYQMRHAKDNAVVITTDDESRRPIGIITDTDIANAVADGKDLNETRIDEIAGADPVTVRSDVTIHEAAKTMISHRFRHLPVVEDGRLVGIVDIVDLCRAMLEVPTPG
jgi:CBS domain-containing protein